MRAIILLTAVIFITACSHNKSETTSTFENAIADSFSRLAELEKIKSSAYLDSAIAKGEITIGMLARNNANPQQIDKMIESFVQSKLLKFNIAKNSVFVSDEIWSYSERAFIEGLSANLYYYCGRRGMTNEILYVFDNKTKKPLFYYSYQKGLHSFDGGYIDFPLNKIPEYN